MCLLVISTYCLHLSPIHDIDLEGISRKREVSGNLRQLGEEDEDERRAFISTHDLLTGELGCLLFHRISMESI